MKLGKNFAVLSLLGFLICIPAMSFALDHYVSPSGNDVSSVLIIFTSANNCRSQSNPCRTIEHAIGQTQSGAVIHLLPGSYAENDLSIPHDLSIIGGGKNASVIQTHGVPSFLAVQSASVVLEDLMIQGRREVNSGGSLTLNHLQIDGGSSLIVDGHTILNDVAVTGDSWVENGGYMEFEHGAIVGNDLSAQPTGVALENNGEMIVRNSLISSNRSGRLGGGIKNEYGATLVISSSVISNNVATATPIHSPKGGGIHNAGDLSLTASEVSGNEGEGINNWGTAIIENSRLLNNRGHGIGSNYHLVIRGGEISGNEGRGIIVSERGALTVTGTRIFRNQGGGLNVLEGVEAILTDAMVEENRSDGDGAGILNHGDVTLLRTSLHRNATEEGSGGGLANNGQALLIDSSIEENFANKGGGVFQFRNSYDPRQPRLEILSSTIAHNEAAAVGGGISAGRPGTGETHGRILLNQVTLSGNEAGIAGAGLYIVGAGDTHIRSSTIAFNRLAETEVYYGAAIASDSSDASVSLKNTLIAENLGGNGATWAPPCTGAVVSQGYNLVDDGANFCNLNAAGDQRGQRAVLWSLDGYGGPTKTHLLGTGSPAIDRGDPSGCNGLYDDLSEYRFSEDQRGAGFVRHAGYYWGNPNRCDIGAMELPTLPIRPIDTRGQPVPFNGTLTK